MKQKKIRLVVLIPENIDAFARREAEARKMTLSAYVRFLLKKAKNKSKKLKQPIS